VARTGERRGAYRILVGRPEGKRSLGRRRLRWEGNIKIGSSGGGMAVMNWIDLAGACECGNEPPGSIKCGEFLG
jgi:hypothetical protein